MKGNERSREVGIEKGRRGEGEEMRGVGRRGWIRVGRRGKEKGWGGEERRGGRC